MGLERVEETYVASPDAWRAREGFARQGLGRLLYLKDVTLHLVGRELATRYRRSLLGWLWSLAPPLLQLAIFHFVFTRLIPLNVENFALFLLTGILAWNLFSTGLSLATGSLERHRNLVLKPMFPTFVLPFVYVLVGFVDYLVALPVLLIAIAVTTGLDMTALVLPVLLAVQLLLTVGLGLVFAPLNVFFRDVAHFVGLGLMLGFWLTPVFYTRSTVPDRFSLVYDLNPMAHLIEAQRNVLLYGVSPSLKSLALVALGSLVVFAAGAALFARSRQTLPEQL